MKFLVLSLLVVACTAVPYNSYSSSSYQTGYTPSVAKFGSFGSSSYGGSYSAGAPRIALLLTGSGLNSGYSGISSGLTGGYGLGYGNVAGYSAGVAAPSYQIVQAPAVQTVALQAAPAVQTIALAAQPSYQAVSTYGAGYRQQAVSNFAGLAQHRSDNFESVVPAAIQQTARTVEYRQIPNQEQPIQAQVVEVEPSDNPVHLHFKTRSSTLSVSQAHTPAQPTELKAESAQDEPQRLSIEVQKPVIQNVREVITPYRQVEQEILPVQESLHTIVSKGEQRQQYQGQQVNYGLQQNTYSTVAAAPAIATVQAVQPVQTIAVQAAPAVQTVAVQPVQVAAVENVQVAAATPAVAHYQSANYVQAAPAVSTLAISQPSAIHSTGHFQSGNQYGARFQSLSAHAQPLSTSSYSSSSSSSSSYKPIVSKFQKDNY